MKKLAYLVFFMVPFLLVMGCNPDKDTDDNTNLDDSTTVIDDGTSKIFYLVPSPEDVFGFADDQDLIFNKDFLNPVDNLAKYNDVKLQEFNFGVYAADLAYCAASNKNDETVQYLNVVRELSQKVGLADVFNESLVYRIEHVSPVKDSLISLSNDTYFDIMRFLERNDRQTTLSIMAAGGWIESMFLVVNQTEYSDVNTIQKIADQKIIISNLWMFLSQNETDPNVKAVLDEFKPIFDLYQSLDVVASDNNNIITDDNETVFVVGGNNKTLISDAQYQELKNIIVDARNKLTLNNVTL
ncbi:MAG: hypothetical protein JXR68_04655 [Bacteroidales bacterium]|nr:hypothetical protein [Bacteroidales bacterium]